MSTRRLTAVVSLVCFTLASQGISMGTEAVSWRNNVDAAKIEASQTGKLVLLHFYTSTCGPCKMLDQNVFSQAQIGDEIERNYVPVKVNAELAPALAASYNIERVPTEIVLNAQGNVIASLSCPQNPSEYTAQLSNLADHYRQHTHGSRANSNQAPVQAAYAGLQVGQYSQQPAATQPTAAQNTGPTITSNPYTAAQQTNYSPVNSNAYGNPTVAANYGGANPTMPANAMPNSYRQGPQEVQPQQAAPQQYVAQQAIQPQVTVNPAAMAQNANPAGQVNTVSHMSVTRQLPPGSPPLAFEGYCPVALKSAHKWVAGDLRFGAIHRGRTFLFMGEEQRQQFLANPDAYCPVFSGMDPVLLLDDNQVVEGSRRYGFEYRGAFYLFANQQSMDRFKSQPDQYAAGVRQAMARMETSATNGTALR
jgi:YHS domain-containing protein/thioredoxin-like negative regulator of GroEL